MKVFVISDTGEALTFHYGAIKPDDKFKNATAGNALTFHYGAIKPLRQMC